MMLIYDFLGFSSTNLALYQPCYRSSYLASLTSTDILSSLPIHLSLSNSNRIFKSVTAQKGEIKYLLLLLLLIHAFVAFFLE